MEEEELADLDRQIKNSVNNYLEIYQALSEMQEVPTEKMLSEKEERALFEYSYPKLSPGWFTYHKHKAKSGKYLDNGKCPICGKDRQYILIKQNIQPMCYRCYQAVRGYRELLFDPLKMKRKRDLTSVDCQKIVKYMNTYSKKKLIALAAVGAMIAVDLKNK